MHHISETVDVYPVLSEWAAVSAFMFSVYFCLQKSFFFFLIWLLCADKRIGITSPFTVPMVPTVAHHESPWKQTSKAEEITLIENIIESWVSFLTKEIKQGIKSTRYCSTKQFYEWLFRKEIMVKLCFRYVLCWPTRGHEPLYCRPLPCRATCACVFTRTHTLHVFTHNQGRQQKWRSCSVCWGEHIARGFSRGGMNTFIWDIKCVFVYYGMHVYWLWGSVSACADVCAVSCIIATVISSCEAVLKTLTLSLWDSFARFVLEKPCSPNKVISVVEFFINGTVSHDDALRATFDSFLCGWICCFEAMKWILQGGHNSRGWF